MLRRQCKQLASFSLFRGAQSSFCSCEKLQSETPGIEGLKSDHWQGSAAHLDQLCPHLVANFEFNQLELLKTIF